MQLLVVDFAVAFANPKPPFSASGSVTAFPNHSLKNVGEKGRTLTSFVSVNRSLMASGYYSLLVVDFAVALADPRAPVGFAGL
jgi:hypothetical protein